MGNEKKSRRKTKCSSNEEIKKMISNCRNLLLVNTDHSYAAPLHYGRVKVSKNKKGVSEGESEGDDNGTADNAETNELNSKERSPTPVEKQENVIENTYSEKIETEVELVPKENIRSRQVKSSNVNIENIAGHTDAIESVFLKEEVIETSAEVPEEDNSKDISTRNTNKNNNTSSGSITSTKNVNVEKGTLPEICILCATTNMSRKNYTLIIHFADMIMDLSGVNILESNVSPIACSICFKYILEMWNFKQQIITADKFIKEKIPKHLGINLISTFDSRNVPKPVPFEYIDYKDNELTKPNRTKRGSSDENLKNIKRKKRFKSKSLSEERTASCTSVKLNEVTLVPIENILKDNRTNGADKDCIEIPKCTICGRIYKNNRLKDCDCQKKRKEKFVCSVCGKQYPLLRSLRRHEIIHKTKCYVCDICKRAFRLKLYLIKHIKKHLIQKPFDCVYCNKKFTTKWNLCQHKRLHTNSLPYKCKICPAAYRYSITLKKHICKFHALNKFVKSDT